LEALIEACPEHCDKEGYEAHPSFIKNGKTWLKGLDGKEYEILVFGEHSLKNLNGARLICEQIGISSSEFYEAITGFKGAAKRLELVGQNANSLLYKDFAHAPSKVEATTRALKTQFPAHQLTACLELHTFSSLNPVFLPQYQGTLAQADKAIVYLSEHARAIKRMDRIEESVIQDYFKHPNLIVLRESEALRAEILGHKKEDSNVLMMSSGTFDGLDLRALAVDLGLLTV
jgi:UDP-N-acetylmuramate: L-alanyl-gamma-D-glutamyl-meso-diaminopimelate ligase